MYTGTSSACARSKIGQKRLSSKNTPFVGQTLAGRAVLTLVEGRVRFDLDGRVR